MKTKTPKPIVPASAYEPADNYLLIKPELEPEVSDGGILIPDQARRNLNEGEILKVGKNVSPEYRPGMFIVFTPSSEFRLELEKGYVLCVVAEPNIIMFRKDVKSLFPIEHEADKEPGVSPRHPLVKPLGRCPDHNNFLPCPICKL